MPPQNLDVILSSTSKGVYTVYDMGNNEVSSSTRNWEADGDEIVENMTGIDSVSGSISEKEEPDEEDEGEDKKSVGSQVGDGAGLRLSFAIFVIWAFFC